MVINLKQFIKNYIPFKSIKGIMPWWLKVGSKMVIYRLPIGDKFWKSMGASHFLIPIFYVHCQVYKNPGKNVVLLPE